jgi:hypothetical protein
MKLNGVTAPAEINTAMEYGTPILTINKLVAIEIPVAAMEVV